MHLKAPANSSEPEFAAHSAQTLPLLICAQSGRFLAELAKRAGYCVWVVDAFADQDTLVAADKLSCLPDFGSASCATLLATLLEISNQQPCQLIFGTGIERFYPLIENLPAQMHYLGNPPEALAQICTPARWFALLTQRSIAHPETCQQARPGFLFKAAQQWGGSHIQMTALASTQAGYYQRFESGQSGSVLFMATVDQPYWLSSNRQFCKASQQGDFTLAAMDNQLRLTAPQKTTLQHIIRQLADHLQLRGLNALDFLITDNGDIKVLELNPRPSASMMLLEPDLPWLTWHLEACQGHLPAIPESTSGTSRALLYCFAPADLKIPIGMNWPSFCHDQPVSGTFIKAGEVVCTLILTTLDESKSGQKTVHQLLEKCFI